MPSLFETHCPRCGLCCNGGLFDDVRLTRSEPSPGLAKAHLPLAAQGPDTFLPQPCTALGPDGLCSVYAHRPRQCRRFVCGVLLRLESGELQPAEATAWIRRATRRRLTLLRLLRKLGDNEEERPLAERCQAMLRQPIDLEAPPGDRRLRHRFFRYYTEYQGWVDGVFLG